MTLIYKCVSKYVPCARSASFNCPKDIFAFLFSIRTGNYSVFVVKKLMVSYQMAGIMQNSLHQCESFAMMTDCRVSLWITQKVIYHISLASLLRDFAQACSAENHDCVTSAEWVTITTAKCWFHHLWTLCRQCVAVPPKLLEGTVKQWSIYTAGNVKHIHPWVLKQKPFVPFTRSGHSLDIY